MEKLISLLGDGCFHSGEELGASLGISRAAVWKKIQALAELGLELDAVRGKGYRLPSTIEMLDKKAIEKHLSADVRKNVGVALHLTTPSTNDEVKAQVGNGERLQVCIAEHQSAGRGRRGRVWQSPFGASLYYSLLWRVDSGLSTMDGLSLAVGLVVVKTLESLGVQGLSLKWPNDILVENKKLAGVLLEISGDPMGTCEVVIGIGINLFLGLEHKKKIDQPVTDVHTAAGRSVGKNKIAGLLTTNLVAMLDTFQQHGFVPFKNVWQEYDAFAGQWVTLSAGENAITGVATGVSDSGAVLIRNDAGITAYAGGEISLRKL